MEIRLAENGDLSGWVQLVEPMRHLFPGLETPESMEGYARDIAGAISRQEALCAVENGTVCGVLAFSRAENELAFLAVSAQHRRSALVRARRRRTCRSVSSRCDKSTAPAFQQNYGACSICRPVSPRLTQLLPFG